jgi:hypothetical protein
VKKLRKQDEKKEDERRSREQVFLGALASVQRRRGVEIGRS